MTSPSYSDTESATAVPGRRLRSETPAAAWRAVLVAALAALPATLSAPTPAEGQFSVRPVIHHFPAGESVTRVASVKNEGDRARQLRLYAADFDRSRSGKHRFMTAGEHERSCAGRLEVFPEQLRLEPGGSADVRITLRPGPRTCWSVIFVETVGADRGGVHIGQRIGIKVFGYGADSSPDASLDSVRVTPGERSVEVTFTVRNAGEVPVRPGGAVEIRTLAGRVVAEREIDPFGVLPGHDRAVTATVKTKLEAGRYLAVPILDIGAEYLLGGQAAFRAPRTVASGSDG